MLQIDGTETQSPAPVYKAIVRPEAGRMTLFRTQQPDDSPKPLQRHQRAERYVPPWEASRSTRPGRDRNKIVDFAVERRLGRMATLTYDGAAHELTVPDCDAEFARYVRKLRKLYPGFDWVEVLQRGSKSGRLHHHVLVPNKIRTDHIRELWTPGHVNLREARKASTVRRQAAYVTLDFSGEQDKRVRFHRYRRSRSGKSVRTEEIIGTRTQLEAELRQMTGSDEEITFIESKHEYCEGILLWDPY